MTETILCPICTQRIFPFIGSKSSPFLIITDESSTDDRIKFQPYTGGFGWVLRNELDRIANFDLHSCRRGYMYYHPMGNGKESEACKANSIEQVLLEAKGKKAILLLGSKTVKYFTGQSIDAVSSLRVTSPYLSCKYIIAGLSPANVLSGTIGETRLVMLRWKELLDELGVTE